MKKNIKKFNNNLIVCFFTGFILSITLFSFISYVYASVISSKVTFDDTNVTITADSVQEAIDSLNLIKKNQKETYEEYKLRVLNFMYPVGSIYISIENESPENIFGGVWTRFAKGRVLVGYNPNENEFNEIKKTGGSKYTQSHYHGIPSISLNETGSAHKHQMYYTSFKLKSGTNAHSQNGTANTYASIVSGGVHSHTISYTTSSSGAGDSTSGNLQPYKTVYMWERTS